jgi:hypothetical protein
MHRFKVQLDPPVINWHKPDEPIHWHFNVEAETAEKALAIIWNTSDGHTGEGRPPWDKAGLADLSALERDTRKLASVIQVYRTIRDYRLNRHPHLPFCVGRHIYLMIVTLRARPRIFLRPLLEAPTFQRCHRRISTALRFTATRSPSYRIAR